MTIKCCSSGNIDHQIQFCKKIGAAKTTQSFVRALLGRKKFISRLELKKITIEDLKNQRTLDKIINLKDLFLIFPKANAGKADVYLLDNIVLKTLIKPGYHVVLSNRFSKIQQAVNILKENNFENIVVPKAILCSDCILAEERLPINNIRIIKETIGLYIEHKEQFTDAVKEFTRLLCQADFWDIIGKDGLGRYDNVALYLQEGKGKIGLVDLENFEIGVDSSIKDWNFEKWRSIIILFPYHFETILEEAKKFDPDIESHREKLENQRDRILKIFKREYLDHLEFIKKHRIEQRNPLQLANITSVEKEELKKEIIPLLKKEIISLNRYYGHSDWFRDKTSKQLEYFEQNFSQVLDYIDEVLIQYLKKNMEFYNPANSVEEFLCFRTIVLSFIEHDDFIHVIADKIMDATDGEIVIRFDIMASIVLTIFLKLEDKKILSHKFYPNLGQCTIMC